MNMHLKIQAYIHKIHAYMYNCTYVWYICVYIKAFTNKCLYKHGPRLKHHNMITEITRVRHSQTEMVHLRNADQSTNAIKD